MIGYTSDPILTIIMCAYNEMGRIQPALEDVFEALEERSERVEIIILDNGSTDGTRQWLVNLAHPDVRVELNEKNLGKGGSIKKGLSLSRGRYVVIHDPDMEYRASDIWGLLDLARKNGDSLILGSRVLGGQIRYKYLLNYLGVKFLTQVTNILYGARLTDTATAMKLIDGDLARRLDLESSGFDLDFELVVRVLRLGGTISEVRVEYNPRTVAQGKKIRAWRDGSLSLKVILRDRLLPSARFVKPLLETTEILPKCAELTYQQPADILEDE